MSNNSFNSDYKNYQEAFDSNDIDTMTPALQDIIDRDTAHHKSSTEIDLNECDNASDGILPDDFPTKNRMVIRFLKRTIKTTTERLVNFLTQRYPWFNEISVANVGDMSGVAKLITELYASEWYNDYNEPAPIFYQLFENVLKYGNSQIYDNWQFDEKTYTKKVKINQRMKKGFDTPEAFKEIQEKIQNKEKFNIDDYVEYDIDEVEVTKIIKDCLDVEVVDPREIRIDCRTTQNDLSDCKHFFIHRYPDYDDLIKIFDKKDLEGLDVKNDNQSNAEIASNSTTNDNYERNKSIKKIFNNHIIEFWGYGKNIFALIETSESSGSSVSRIQKILVPSKRKGEDNQFDNPHEHGKLPISNFICSFKPYTYKGEGQIEENMDNYIWTMFFINKHLDEIEKQGNPGYIYNKDSDVDTDELMSIISGEGNFAGATGNLKDAVMPFQTGNSALLFRDTFNFLYNQLQTQTSSTDYSSGGAGNSSQYTQTLGGIQEILAESDKKAMAILQINFKALKQMINRHLSLIFQYMKENKVLQIKGVKGIEFSEIRRRFSTSDLSLEDFLNNPDDDETSENELNVLREKYKDKPFEETNSKTKKIYILDDIAKLNLKFDINLNYEIQANRFAKLQNALEVSMKLIGAGVPIDLVEVARRYFEEGLGLENIVKDPEKDKKLAEYEVKRFESQYVKGMAAFKSGIISEDRFYELMNDAVNEPQESEGKNPLVFIQALIEFQNTIQYPQAIQPQIDRYKKILESMQQAAQELQRQNQQMNAGNNQGSTRQPNNRNNTSIGQGNSKQGGNVVE